MTAARWASLSVCSCRRFSLKSREKRPRTAATRRLRRFFFRCANQTLGLPIRTDTQARISWTRKRIFYSNARQVEVNRERMSRNQCSKPGYRRRNAMGARHGAEFQTSADPRLRLALGRDDDPAVARLREGPVRPLPSRAALHARSGSEVARQARDDLKPKLPVSVNLFF